MKDAADAASYDAAIVGGGPAGSTLARELTAAGWSAVVIDKATFPRDKVCAGWITPAVLSEVGLDPDDYTRDRTLQPITGFVVGLLGGRVHDLRYDQTVSYGIRRCELDDYLLRRCGADLVLGRPLQSIEREGKEWKLRVGRSQGADDEKLVRTPLLIGAGGHGCPVARELSRGAHNEGDLVVAQEVELRMSGAQEDACAVSPEAPELYFCRDLAGYGWCFRKGAYLNVGLGRLDRSELRQHVSGFVRFLRDEGRISFEPAQPFRGHAYLLQGHRWRNPIAEGALLVGDAAGLAYPASGEGIRPAVESALLAAEVVQEAAGSYAEQDLAPYRESLEARFGTLAKGRRWRLPKGLRKALAPALMAMPWFAREVLIDRWFLNRHQAPLTGLAAKRARPCRSVAAAPRSPIPEPHPSGPSPPPAARSRSSV